MYDNSRNGKVIINHQMFNNFIFLQLFAIGILVFSWVASSEIKGTYEDGVEYIPVTVTYTDSEQYYERRLDGERELRYKNTFRYMVDGINYRKVITDQFHRISVGTQEEWYYNPNDPGVIAPYRSLEEVSIGIQIPWILYGFVQVCAVICLILAMTKEPKQKNNEEKTMQVFDSVFDGPSLVGPEEAWQPEAAFKKYREEMEEFPETDAGREGMVRQEEGMESKTDQYGFHLHQE